MGDDLTFGILFTNIIDKHIPDLTDADSDEMSSMSNEYGWEDLALRTCSCGERIDGFYQYVNHLKWVFTNG